MPKIIEIEPVKVII